MELSNGIKDAPLVSVWMITYNHEKYIAQSIESVINQSTNFDFELVIGEDHSTDRTRQICLHYQAKYPGKVKVLDHKGNVGIHQNILLTLNACSGKYVAMLEGDDYWTDSQKLQKQVDFLNEHPDFVMCYQKTLEVNELTGHRKITNENDRAETGLEEILQRGWFMRTGSLLFRNKILTEVPPWFFQYSSTDYILHILLAQHGRIGFLNDLTSVYRRHEGGITQDFQSKLIVFNKKKVQLLDVIDQHFNYSYHPQIKHQKKGLYSASFVYALQNLHGLRDIGYLLHLLPSIPYSMVFRRFFYFLKRKLA